jgi:hypothetical protein
MAPHSGTISPQETHPVAFRRLEDKIHELVKKAISTPDDSPDLNGIIKELNDALREHSKRLRKLATEKLKPNRRKS